MQTQFKATIRALLGASMLIAPAVARAQTTVGTVESSSDNQVEDIVVTAQKREQTVQKVPIAITAVSSDMIVDRGVTSLVDLAQLVPSAKASDFSGNISFYIRGVGTNLLGTGIDPGVAVHEDGVYIARSKSQAGSFFDLERVEVLRGPQGTLYGRNATAGVVNLITRQPTEEFEANGAIRYGNYNSLELEGGVGGAIVPGVVTARIAGVYRRHDGFSRNIASNREFDDQNEGGLRATVRVEASPSFNYTVSGEYFRRNDASGSFQLIGLAKPGVALAGAVRGFQWTAVPRTIASELQPVNTLDNWAVTGIGNWSVADGVAIKSTTAFRHTKSFRMIDFDFSTMPVPLTFADKNRQFSQELQLTVSSARNKLVAGAYYLNENFFNETQAPLTPIINVPKAIFLQRGTGKVDTLGFYVNDEFQLTSKLTLTAGLRYSYEKRSHVSEAAAGVAITNISGKKTWKAVTPKVTLDYEFTSDVKAYVSFGQGFKSGAFLVGTTNAPVDPEHVNAYEAGLKTRLFNRRLEANIAVFHYEYTDLQVNRVVGFATLVENAASAKVDGIELEGRAALWQGASANFSAAYLDARFAQYSTADAARLELGVLDLKNFRLPYAPRWSTSGTLQQKISLPGGGALTASGTATWTSRIFFTPFNVDAVSQKEHADLQARLSYAPADNRWHVAVWGRNLTNNLVKVNGDIASSLLGFPIRGNYADPRRYGVELGFNF